MKLLSRAGALLRDPPGALVDAVWVALIGGIILPAAWFLWQPHSEYVFAYLPKFLFILAAVAVGGLRLASLIGWGVGWLLDPTTSRAGIPASRIKVAKLAA